jgi:enoyl-CoA hydratase/carnithine racemase
MQIINQSNAPLLFEQNGSIGYLILNAPPKNEMNAAFFETLSRLSEQVLPKFSLKGLIIYGRGRHFSSGADINGLRDQVRSENINFFYHNVSNMLKLNDLPFPVIAAITGSCFGSALELALICHYRIAAERAVFAFPEVTFDLMPGLGGTIFLPQIVGKAKAIELLLSGRTLLADEALQIGLVDRVVNKNDLIDKAEMLIQRLSAQVS